MQIVRTNARADSSLHPPPPLPLLSRRWVFGLISMIHSSPSRDFNNPRYSDSARCLRCSRPPSTPKICIERVCTYISYSILFRRLVFLRLLLRLRTFRSHLRLTAVQMKLISANGINEKAYLPLAHLHKRNQKLFKMEPKQFARGRRERREHSLRLLEQWPAETKGDR